MMSKSLKKRGVLQNYIFNLISQVVALITPLITAPYVSRVLGTAGVGQYSFVYSISNYFILVGSLGFAYYAQREIAALQNDRNAQSIVFWEIVIARFVSVGFISLVFIGSICVGLYGDYTNLMWIMSISVIATAFDVTFFFQGNDVFDVIVLRNIVIRCIGIACIFLFVKDSSDLWKYVAYQCVIGLVSNLSIWPKLRLFLVRINPHNINIWRHFRPTIKLFIPTIAMSVYTMLDRTLIGVLVPGEVTRTLKNGMLVVQKISDIENGYYEQSEKIVKMTMTVFTSLTTVLVTRNANDIAEGKNDSFKSNINWAIRFLFFIGCPIMFGIAAIAQNFTPWFFGPGYEKTPYLIMIFSPIVLIIGISNVLGRQYLIPLKRDTEFTIAICIGACFNLVLNLLLIPSLMSFGAAIASITAELIVTVVMWKMTSKEINLGRLIVGSWREILSGIIMFCIVYSTQSYLQPNIVNTLILIIEGTITYFISLFLLRDRVLGLFIKKILHR